MTTIHDDQNGGAIEIASLGCRLNLAEGEAIKRALQENEANDVVVVNTCAVTNEAVRQSKRKIRRLRRAAPDRRLFVTGCAAQIDPSTFADMAEVDGVVGNAEKANPAVWRSALSAPGGDPIVRVNDIMSVRETAPQLVAGYGDRARAFLQVQNGCDHRCTFCVIPYGRGNARSAAVDVVAAQARALAAAGHQELVVTGVDITSWGGDLPGQPRLGTLVAALLTRVPELKRLRLSSIDGAELDPLLEELIVGEERIAPHLHLSVQSGDDMILKRMKRRHSRQDIIDLCARLRRGRPDIAFGADMIAGFPTETEAMHRNSLDLIADAGISFLHVFPFSPRGGTPAARMPQLDGRTIKDRAARLRRAGEQANAAFLDSLVGHTGEAVVESGGVARLGNFAVVRLNDPSEIARPGELLRIRVTNYDADGLHGQPAPRDG